MILLLTSSGNDWDFRYEYWPPMAIAFTLDTLIDL